MMPARYNNRYPGPRQYVCTDHTSGTWMCVYRNMGGLRPDLVGVRHIPYNEIVWC